jgi:tetratricopeptide (TPR) repeat protein
MTQLNISTKSFLLVLFLAAGGMFFTPQAGFAQKSKTEIYFETLAQAESKMNAKQWSEAAALWEQIVKLNPVLGANWNQLGTAYYNAKNHARAVAAYEKALELGFNSANTAYNIACNYALSGEKELALKWLEKAFELKFINLGHAQTDTDLEAIRNEPRYRNIVGLIDTSKMSRDEVWQTD